MRHSDTQPCKPSTQLAKVRGGEAHLGYGVRLSQKANTIQHNEKAHSQPPPWSCGGLDLLAVHTRHSFSSFGSPGNSVEWTVVKKGTLGPIQHPSSSPGLQVCVLLDDHVVLRPPWNRDNAIQREGFYFLKRDRTLHKGWRSTGRWNWGNTSGW